MRLLFIFTTLLLAINSAAAVDKILIVRVTETGVITVNGDAIGSDMLSRYIQERLFKSYMGTGVMHDRIRLEKDNANVPDMVTEVVRQEISEGQRKALTELSLQKYSRRFESLDSKKQEKLKKQFPVLFQTEYT